MEEAEKSPGFMQFLSNEENSSRFYTDKITIDYAS